MGVIIVFGTSNASVQVRVTKAEVPNSLSTSACYGGVTVVYIIITVAGFATTA